MVRTYQLTEAMADRDANALEGQFVDDRYFDLLISHEDAKVLKPDGTPLLVFGHRVLPADVCRRAFAALKRAAKTTDNRGTAAGEVNDRDVAAGSVRRGAVVSGTRFRVVRRDGSLSATNYAKRVQSGIIGYFDRSARTPFCRTTEYTRRDVEGWRSVLPFVRAVDRAFRRGCPDRYAAQRAVVRQTPPEWVIPKTVFSTVTVNRNFRTAVHKDRGDLPQGFGVMSVLRAGEYTGGYLVFPKYGVAVDMGTRDVLLADVHEWHGNTAIHGEAGRYDRISTVLYYRSGMRHCLPPAAEVRRAQSRRPGDPLV